MTPELQVLALVFAWGSAAMAVLMRYCMEIGFDGRDWWRSTAIVAVSPLAFVLLPAGLAIVGAALFGLVVWSLTYPLNPHARWMVRELRACADDNGETRLAHITVRNIRFILGGVAWEYTYNDGGPWFTMRSTMLPGGRSKKVKKTSPPNWRTRVRLVRTARKLRGGR